MNPLALALLGIGLLLVIVGFRGHQDNLIAAITGKAYGKSTLK